MSEDLTISAAAATYLVPGPLALALTQYLAQQPYAEVYELISALQHTHPVDLPYDQILLLLEGVTPADGPAADGG